MKNIKSQLCFTFCAILLLMLVCLTACAQKEQQSDDQIENTIQNMVNNEVTIKYVNGDDELYYRMIASEEFIKQLDLQNWELEETDDILDFDEYLVVRIAEKYEIVIYSNQVGKIYDYYGAYGTYDSEALFYKTALNLQTIVGFLDQHAESLLNCNIGFEN